MYCLRIEVMIIIIWTIYFFHVQCDRQELNRRNAFDFTDEDTVNYKTMLKRLMVELVKDEEVEAAQKAKIVEEKMETEMEKSKRLREEKKKEALERSRQRQADPNYFRQRAEANIIQKRVDEPVGATNEDEDDDEDDEPEENSSNPFETYRPKGRSKIFVR